MSAAKASPQEDEYTKYERARIIGSRALQISMGAPFLVKLSKKKLEALAYNPVEIAKLEFEKGVIPITVKRVLPHERESH
ncbi:DNA-directed RNA polymerase subunit K [Candidatus Woesearchaeota archaeon]|nr:DNA-directed RNA polymerase subunit K [Candidatus Woesearchaeota archaeon]